MRLLDTPRIARGTATLAASDTDLARLVRRHGRPPLWARRPGFSTLVWIMLEQQVSIASARAVYQRLRGAAGRLTPPALLRLSETRLRRLGLTRQKTAYCLGLAREIVDGRLRLADLARLGDEEARRRLTEIRGIGPWTADVYLLMALRRPDVWPKGDLALVKSVRRAKGLAADPSEDEMEVIGEPWRPWRAVAARILWLDYLSKPSGTIRG